ELHQFDCVDLQRFPGGTPYPEIAGAVAARLHLPALQPTTPSGRLLVALDATGIGRAVAELFLDAGLPADVSVVTSTGGIETVREPWLDRAGRRVATWYRVPKPDLVATIQAALQTGRLRFAGALPLGATLRRELLSFRASPTAPDMLSGRDSPDD